MTTSRFNQATITVDTSALVIGIGSDTYQIDLDSSQMLNLAMILLENGQKQTQQTKAQDDNTTA